MDEEARVKHRLSALEMMEHNRPLRRHWVARLTAMLLDFAIVVVLSILIGLVLRSSFMGGGLEKFLIITNIIVAVFWVFYSAVMEYYFGFTLGKKAMRLRVQSLKGPLFFWKAILRNVSKVQIVLLVIDTLIGMATGGDPRQRFLDRIANTTVVREGKPEKHSEEVA